MTTVRPVLLDLFCCAGGAARGYERAGFDVIGIDIEWHPTYPFEFILGDALDTSIWPTGLAAIHASPPCQRHSTLRTGITGIYDDLLSQTRDSLRDSGLPYVIENVVGAPMVDPVMLCGTALGCVDGDAELRRHRLFEANFPIVGAECQHSPDRHVLGVYGDLSNEDRSNGTLGRGTKAGRARARRLMGIDWPMSDRELAEAIPPTYAEHIGHQLMCAVTTDASV